MAHPLQTKAKITAGDLYEPRRIVLILGNGFDLDLNLPTRYSDFWRTDFCPKDYPAPLIKHLNECLGDSIDAIRWYDLENELLSYFHRINDPKKRFDVIDQYEREFIEKVHPDSYYHTGNVPYEYFSSVNSLREKGYFRQEARNGMICYVIPERDVLLKDYVWRDREAFRLIKKGLCRYISSINLSIDEKNMATCVLCALSSIADTDIVSIYNFNYTKLPYGVEDNPKLSSFHVHGDCTSRNIIIGTGDYPEFESNKDYDYLQKSFDQNFTPPRLVPDLLEATDVVFFGHSIGENDRQYFKSFFKQQTDNVKTNRINITIFTKDDSSELEIKRALQKMTDSNLSILFSQNNVKIIKTENIKEHPNAFLSFLKYYVPVREIRKPIEDIFNSIP